MTNSGSAKWKHKILAECCLKRLSSNILKRDICKLQRPGTLRSEVEESRVESCLPTDVQYACRYWVEHLHSSEQVHAGLCDDGLIHSILRTHFLHWLEALSLIGRISEGVLVIELLRSMLTVGDPYPGYKILDADLANSNLTDKLVYSLLSAMRDGSSLIIDPLSKRHLSKLICLL
jgi:hypothetical protein